MRLLHTADWHLGNMMHNVDRMREQELFLVWLVNVVMDERIDTLVVSGDIFDSYVPPNWAQKHYYGFLASLLNTDCRNVVIVGGNHDSGRFLDATNELLDVLNIHVVGTLSDKKPEEAVFELEDKDGNTAAVCAAVPFVPEILLDEYCKDRKRCAPGTFSDIAYSVLYKEYLDKALELKQDRDIPLIATGHLYASGLEGRYEGVEEEKRTDDGIRQMDVVGNLGKVPLSAFPDEFDYVALGHIHYHTRVGKNDKVRYSGSPFVMGFDEADMSHYVLRVDIGNEKDTHAISVKPIEVPGSVSFKRLSGSVDEVKEKIEEIIKHAEETDDMEGYCIELYYNAEDAGALRSLIDAIDFPDNVNVVSWKVKETKNPYRVDLGEHDIRSISSINPEDIVRQLVLSKTNLVKGDMTEEEYKKRQEEEVKKYLPYFMEAFDTALTKGECNEDH
ncbi:MAG: exonuclease subunit SbcD [Lachnospiraceae bacterium]|nr:exonuclease subunit SbcD [Lachnospiraceae bacterium]